MKTRGSEAAVTNRKAGGRSWDRFEAAAPWLLSRRPLRHHLPLLFIFSKRFHETRPNYELTSTFRSRRFAFDDRPVVAKENDDESRLKVKESERERAKGVRER